MPDDLRAWLRDHPVDDEADVVLAAARGQRSFLLWLTIRTVIAVIAGGLLLTGLLQLRSWALDSSVFTTEARLHVDPVTGKEPLKITADVSGSSPGWGSKIVTVRFDFGDGTITGPQSDPVARHTYTDAGTYVITATVTDTNDRSDQASAIVTVEPRSPGLPRASLNVSPSAGPAPLQVVADATGSSPGAGAQIQRYRFDFGDGSPSKTQRKSVASHSYQKPGSYRLTVRVRDTAGKADESSRVVNVTVPHRPLKAVLRVTPVKGVAPLDVAVDASASAPQTGATVRDYTFDYGDGTVNGPQPDPRDQHTYQAAGTHKVTVTVTDSLGGTDQARKTVKVAEPRPTVARLVVRPRTGTAPLGVRADASKSSRAEGVSILSYQFDFDDGGPDAIQQSPEASHTYKSPGEYTVTVTIKDSNGKTSMGSQPVRVIEEPQPPTASLQVTDLEGDSKYDPDGVLQGVAPFGVRADATKSSPSSGSSIAGYQIDFGDGTGLQPAPKGVAEHTYAETTTHTVRVIVTDVNGKTAEAIRYVKVSKEVE